MLQNRLEISNAMQSDISAAQPDLVHLSIEQLLSIRASAIDFFTESASHQGHIGFLAKLAGLVSEKLVKRLLVGTEDEESETCANVSADALRAVGLLVTRAYGAKERLEASQQPPLLPQCWALELKESDWPGCQCVLFNPAELWIKVLPLENVDFAAESKSQHLCVIRERSDRNRKDRVHHWEFFRVESSPEGIRETLVSRPRASMVSLTKELCSVLKRRATIQKPDTSEGFVKQSDQPSDNGNSINPSLRPTRKFADASALGNAKELRGQMGRFCRSVISLTVKPDPQLDDATAGTCGGSKKHDATAKTCSGSKKLGGATGGLRGSMNLLASRPDPKPNDATASPLGDLQKSGRFPSMPSLRPVGRRGTHAREVSEGPHHSMSANLEKKRMVELRSVSTTPRKSASFGVNDVRDKLFCNSSSDGRLSVSTMVRTMEENCLKGSTKSAAIAPTFNDPATDQ